MKNRTKPKKYKRGRPKSPKVEFMDIEELKIRVKEIKKRKSGIYQKKKKT
ncbi:MAG: hypothetical protein ACUVTN_08445 [Thermodesulfobacteriota bacterium]